MWTDPLPPDPMEARPADAGDAWIEYLPDVARYAGAVS